MTNQHPGKTSRRWYQFSLRTMLILVTVACLLFAVSAWALNARRRIQERRDWIAENTRGGKSVQRVHVNTLFAPRAPDGLWLLGEKGVASISFDFGATIEECNAARRLFPEAEIRAPRDKSGTGEPNHPPG